jgi:Rha family phage regulatory protein
MHKINGHKKAPSAPTLEASKSTSSIRKNVMTNNTTVVDMRKFVEARDGQAFTTSQNVAEAFGKLHKDVLRKIEGLECSANFTERNFTLSEYIDGSGRRLPQWGMTKDGFMFLVMGFTGKSAAAIKEGYIAAFNEMAARLNLAPEVLVSDLVGSVIGSTGEVVLNRVIEQKGYRIAPAMQRSFTHTMKSRLRSRFNVQKTSLIPADQMEAACNFIAAYVLEGEWLDKEVQADSKVNWPASRWLAESMPDVRKRMTAFQGDGNMMLTPDMLFGESEFVSPTLRAIAELEKQGHNLEACRLEVLAMRHHLEGAEYAFSGLRLWADRTQGKGIRFSVQEDAA